MISIRIKPAKTGGIGADIPVEEGEASREGFFLSSTWKLLGPFTGLSSGDGFISAELLSQEECAPILIVEEEGCRILHIRSAAPAAPLRLKNASTGTAWKCASQ